MRGGSWLFCWTLLVAARLGASEPQPLKVVEYGAERGLSGHLLSVVAEDQRGRIWVGTWGGGAFRYDGVGFRQFSTRDGLLSDSVSTIRIGSHNEVWISTVAAAGSPGGFSVVLDDRVLPPIEGQGWSAGTGLTASDGSVWFALRAGGLARYDGTLLRVIDGLDASWVRRIVEDPGGGLWLLGRRAEADPSSLGQLFRREPGGTGFAAHGTAEGLPRAAFHDLHLDVRGNVWIATAAGLFRGSGGRFEAAQLEGASVARPIHAISEDRDLTLWLATEGAAIAVRDGVAREWKLPEELRGAPVLGVAGDPLGGVFLVTPSQLLRLEGRVAEARLLADRSELFGASDATATLELERRIDDMLDLNRRLLVDREGGVWAIDGRVLLRYAGHEARRYGRGEGLPSEDVRALHVDAAGALWVGTTAGLAQLDPENAYLEPVLGLNEPVRALFSDRGGYVYVASESGVRRVAPAPEPGAPRVLEAAPWPPAEGLREPAALTTDADGSLWIVSPAELSRSGLAGLTSQALGTRAPDPYALSSHEGGLWIGHQAGVLVRREEGLEALPGLAGRAVRGFLTLRGSEAGGERLLAVTREGLVSLPDGGAVPPDLRGSGLNAALAGSTGALWLGLEAGILKVEGGAQSLLSGAPYPIAPAQALAEDAEGRIWIATAAGLYRHVPRRLGPSVWLESPPPAASGQGASIALGGPCRELSLEFAGASYLGSRDAYDLRFESWLEPLEEGYGEPVYERRRRIEGLAPGSYTLRVRSVSRDLARSEPLEVSISVGSPAEQPAPTPTPRLVLPDIAR